MHQDPGDRKKPKPFPSLSLQGSLPVAIQQRQRGRPRLWPDNGHAMPFEQHGARRCERHHVPIPSAKSGMGPALINQHAMPSPFLPSSQDLADYKRTRELQSVQVSQLLSSLGYERTALSVAIWRRYADAASRHLFLLEPNNYQRDGNPTECTLLHKLRFPASSLARQFIAAMAARYPEFHLHRCHPPMESLDDHEVELTHRVMMSAAEVTRVACQVLALAHIYLAHDDYHWVPVSDGYQIEKPGPITFASWPHRPKRVMRLRAEFYGDILLTRLILAPWVCRWTDVESRCNESDGVEVAVTSVFGHEAEFELADDSIKLDDLRWLLNQAVDLHVAAQTLNYADQYSGERLHYDYLDRIEPSEEVRHAMCCRLTSAGKASDNILDRLSEFIEDVAA